MPSPTFPPAVYQTLLAASGDDPQRRDLLGTPERAARAHADLFAGYTENPVALLRSAMEPNDPRHSGPVLLRNLSLYSHCEHHILPMDGVVHVAYRPGPWILGLSKIARAVAALAAQLQSQERLTREIADAINTAATPEGVLVACVARHHCMAHRGVRQTAADTVTLESRGSFLTDAAARQEILTLCRI